MSTNSEDTRIQNAPVSVIMLDLTCYVPYYNRYLMNALNANGTLATLASISHFSDPNYFEQHHVPLLRGVLGSSARTNSNSGKLIRAARFFKFIYNVFFVSAKVIYSRPNILHIQWLPFIHRSYFEWILIASAKLLNVKIVYTVHNVLPHDSGESFVHRYASLYRKMDALICHTNKSKNELVNKLGIAPDSISVIPHGPMLYDLPRPSKKNARKLLDYPEDCIVYLFFGAIRPYKGLIFLLDAWEHAGLSSTTARLVIVGRPEENERKDLEKKLVSSDRFSGVEIDLRFIDDSELVTYIQLADVLVYPYKKIDQSGALLTGMSFRKAIIASRLPSFTEIMSDEENSLLVDYGDIEALSLALKRLSNDGGLREKLAQKSLNLSQEVFGWKNIGDETVHLYRKLIDM